jgi:hypothetical protein
LRAFAGRVELLGGDGSHVRFVPGSLAKSMVTAGSAEISNANGKIKAVKLTMPASGFAQRIGPAQGRAVGVRFTRLVHLEESASRVWEFHPRSTYPEAE